MNYERKIKDLIGKRHEKITIVKMLEERKLDSKGKKQVQWVALCDCGSERVVTSKQFNAKEISSCGCWSKPRNRFNLKGKRFEKLVVLKEEGRNTGGEVMWLIQCECGNTITRSTSDWNRQSSISCGCIRRQTSRMNLIGQTFGKLTVIEESGRGKRNETLWKCSCECGGTISDAVTSELNRGSRTHCGCVYQGSSGSQGRSKSPEYQTWSAMLRRCNNPSDQAYPNYGGRGIIVCKEWESSFDQFIRDMGERTSPEHSLDRIDNNGNYEPDNCRWTNNNIQSRNTRTFKNNTSGIKGIHQVKSTGKWNVRINANKKRHNLGYFINKIDAINARRAAENKYWGKEYQDFDTILNNLEKE